MYKSETLREYYKNKSGNKTASCLLQNGTKEVFGVFPRTAYSGKTFCRHHAFYKISLIVGAGTLWYEGARFELNGATLFLSTPMTTYSWEARSEKQEGWHCLFTDLFMKDIPLDYWISPASLPAGCPVFRMSEEQCAEFSRLFEKMQQELFSGYRFKMELLRSYVCTIIYEALKMLACTGEMKKTDASAWLTRQFLQLLEKQFNKYSPDDPVHLSTPGDFARRLCTHVNHLNRSVKQVTGKTTTALINERMIKEAMLLLKMPEWNIAQIANGLGFEYPANFNLFFKKQTGIAPSVFRNNI